MRPRRLPDRDIVIVADSSYAVLDLLHFCQSLAHPVTFITRLRLDAALYEPAPPRDPGKIERPSLKGQRLPTLKHILEQPDTDWTEVSVAWYDRSVRTLQIASGTAVWYHLGKAPVPIRGPLFVTHKIIEWFVLRWQLEVTFEEVRAHLGVETQRQWSDLAIARTTPALFGLFSWITLAAHVLPAQQHVVPRKAAWYAKALPTFADAIALVRQQLWLASETFSISSHEPEIRKVPAPFNRLIESLCYAA